MLSSVWRRVLWWKNYAVAAAFLALDAVLLLFLTLKARFGRRPLRSPVALVACTGSLSAALLWLPAAQRLIPALRNKGYRVVVALPTEALPLFDGLTENAELLGFDTIAWQQSIRYRWRMACQLADLRADLALQTAFSRTVSGEDSVIRFSRAQRRIAWEGDSHHTTRLGHRLGLRCYNKVLPNPPRKPAPLPAALHATEAHERMLAILGESLSPLSEPVFPQARLQPPSEMGLPERYVILAPGALMDVQRWPEASFAAVADAIHQHYDVPVLLCGSESDSPHAAVIMALSKAVLADLCGKIALSDMPALLAKAALVIGHEGLFVHLASLVGTPSLSITGGGDWGRSLPYCRSRLQPDRLAPVPLSHPMPCYDCGWSCIHPIGPGEAAPCLSSIPPTQVIAALSDHLPRKVEKKKSFGGNEA